MYRRSIKKLEKRFCSVHKEKLLEFGCPGCHKTFCMTCLRDNDLCLSGKNTTIHKNLQKDVVLTLKEGNQSNPE